jgi:hypothetical protein
MSGQQERVSIGPEFHDTEVRKVSVVQPHRLGWIGVNPEEAIAFILSDAPACRKEALFIKVDLGQRDITIVEGDSFFPRREGIGKPGIIIGASQLDLHYLHLLPAPELLLVSPLVSSGPSPFLERVEQGGKIVLRPLGIEPGSKRGLEPVEYPILSLDPEDHGGLQRIEIKEPAPDFHKFTSSLHRADPAGTLPTPWNAGFVEMAWITENFTKSEVQQRQ